MNRHDLQKLANQIARLHRLEPPLVSAVIDQESSWNPCAIKPESESGFVARYGEAYARIVKASASRIDDRWFRYEDLFYCSYGLMQVMYCVAIERFPEVALGLGYPTELCKPETGLDFGCRILAANLARVKGDWGLGLLRYNGGADRDYPRKVLAKIAKYRGNAEGVTAYP